MFYNKIWGHNELQPITSKIEISLSWSLSGNRDVAFTRMVQKDVQTDGQLEVGAEAYMSDACIFYFWSRLHYGWEFTAKFLCIKFSNTVWITHLYCIFDMWQLEDFWNSSYCEYILGLTSHMINQTSESKWKKSLTRLYLKEHKFKVLQYWVYVVAYSTVVDICPCLQKKKVNMSISDFLTLLTKKTFVCNESRKAL